MKPEVDSKYKVFSAVFLGICFVTGMTIFGYCFLLSKQPQKTVTVIGSAKERVVSDIATWSSSFSVKTSESALSEAFKLMKRYEAEVLSVFEQHGIDRKSVKASSITVMENYVPEQLATERSYTLVEYLFVETRDIQEIAERSKLITQELLDKGIVFQSNPVQYYYSKLPELRVKLLSEAVKDAKRRAMEIASTSGLKLLRVVSAKSGVVQVLAPNSTEVSDYGTYDTSTIEKDVMVTVNVVFEVK
ncbi:SIMPL domain-containing protein [Fervidobacterium thailandense]|uniref:SIMPL domain-containing protein n=1 Tax=Fervidobacterium thailandense TaxID=1008305 RepID=A0A1E3G5E8_9BACT|nr:SIMPL domain-containing protein [Fervidobacterium thailandense]ODN31370.1 hypothetical protein A4H02_01000 [Fervidobacterium thailandense]